MSQAENPILPGFYPDPSIIRVEDDFSHTLDGRAISCDMTDSNTGVMIALLGKSDCKSIVQFENFQIS